MKSKLSRKNARKERILAVRQNMVDFDVERAWQKKEKELVSHNAQEERVVFMDESLVLSHGKKMMM